MLFSQRNNLLDDATQFKRLKTRTWNTFDNILGCFHSYCVCSGNIGVYDSNWYIICALADKLGIDITTGNVYAIRMDLNGFLTDATGLDGVFSFIEAHLEALYEPSLLPYGVAGVNIVAVRETAVNMYARILIDENQQYRIYRNQIVPLVSNEEMAEIESASATCFESVNRHIEKAWNHFADRKHPDYENSVKESISAVEAICCTITGTSGAQATLGAAIKKLKDNGVHIHGAMEKAFLALYGWASDENGIRHGGIDFKNVPAEDTKYMLVSCSAFVNYLIEKWSKVS